MEMPLLLHWQWILIDYTVQQIQNHSKYIRGWLALTKWFSKTSQYWPNICRTNSSPLLFLWVCTCTSMQATRDWICVCPYWCCHGSVHEHVIMTPCAEGDVQHQRATTTPCLLFSQILCHQSYTSQKLRHIDLLATRYAPSPAAN